MRYMSNGGSRTTPLGQSASNLDALLEMDLAVSSMNYYCFLSILCMRVTNLGK